MGVDQQPRHPDRELVVGWLVAAPPVAERRHQPRDVVRVCLPCESHLHRRPTLPVPAGRASIVAGLDAPTGELDQRHLWHPFTQMRDWCREEPTVIDRAEGTDLIDTEGRRYIDGVSSLWCSVHGHRHPVIDGAVHAQLDRVAHSTLLGLTHEPAAALAARLVEIAPPGLTRVFSRTRARPRPRWR